MNRQIHLGHHLLPHGRADPVGPVARMRGPHDILQTNGIDRVAMRLHHRKIDQQVRLVDRFRDMNAADQPHLGGLDLNPVRLVEVHHLRTRFARRRTDPGLFQVPARGERGQGRHVADDHLPRPGILEQPDQGADHLRIRGGGRRLAGDHVGLDQDGLSPRGQFLDPADQ